MCGGKIVEIFSHLIVLYSVMRLSLWKHHAKLPIYLPMAHSQFLCMLCFVFLSLYAIRYLFFAKCVKLYISIQLECDFTKIEFILTKLLWVDPKSKKYLTIFKIQSCDLFQMGMGNVAVSWTDRKANKCDKVDVHKCHATARIVGDN